MDGEVLDINVIDAEGLAARLGMSARTVSRWIDDGTLPKPSFRKGKKRYWFAEDLREWKKRVRKGFDNE